MYLLKTNFLFGGKKKKRLEVFLYLIKESGLFKMSILNTSIHQELNSGVGGKESETNML